MNLIWNRCDKGSWCSFLSVNLDHQDLNNLKGVYIIWQGDGPIIRIGQGIVRDRLSIHRKDKEITSHRNLFVTWVEVSSKATLDGIERYLADRLNPLVGHEFPEVSPIEVNLPWPY